MTLLGYAPIELHRSIQAVMHMFAIGRPHRLRRSDLPEQGRTQTSVVVLDQLVHSAVSQLRKPEPPASSSAPRAADMGAVQRLGTA